MMIPKNRDSSGMQAQHAIHKPYGNAGSPSLDETASLKSPKSARYIDDFSASTRLAQSKIAARLNVPLLHEHRRIRLSLGRHLQRFSASGDVRLTPLLMGNPDQNGSRKYH